MCCTALYVRTSVCQQFRVRTAEWIFGKNLSFLDAGNNPLNFKICLILDAKLRVFKRILCRFEIFQADIAVLLFSLLFLSLSSLFPHFHLSISLQIPIFPFPVFPPLYTLLLDVNKFFVSNL